MKKQILVALILTLAIPVALFPQTSPENVSPGRHLRATVTGRSTMFSFTPATSGELIIEAVNFPELPAVLMVLGPDYQQVTTNASSDTLTAAIRFPASENAVYHLAATVLDESSIGGNLELIIRTAASPNTVSTAIPDFTYLYGEIGK